MGSDNFGAHSIIIRIFLIETANGMEAMNIKDREYGDESHKDYRVIIFEDARHFQKQRCHNSLKMFSGLMFSSWTLN